MAKILIIGANSAMAEAAARVWAKRGDHLYLIARNEERLNALVADLGVRGGTVAGHAAADANEVEGHADLIGNAFMALGSVDVALVAYGTLGDQKAGERDALVALQELHTNALSVISLCTHLANRLEGQHQGSLAVISSVAGERGRQSNYIYGTAKAAVSTFLQGLRNRLFKSGVHVLTIKPGFVDTPMTAAFKKGPLWASADKAGACIVSAIDKKKDVAYVPGFWALIMFIIRNIPEFIFKKLKL